MPARNINDTAHVVHRVRVEIQAASRSVALEAQEAFSDCIRNEFPVLLERWFGSRFSPGTKWRKERLELNLGRISARNLRAELTRALAASLDTIEKEIVSETVFPKRNTLNGGDSEPFTLVTERKERSGSSEGEIVLAFVHYLRTGTLPWWLPLARWQAEIPGTLFEGEALMALGPKIRAALRENPRWGLRLLAYPELVTKLFESEVPTPVHAASFKTLIGKLPGRERPRFELALILVQFSSSTVIFPALERVIQNLVRLDGQVLSGSWREIIAEVTRENSTESPEVSFPARRVAEILSRDSVAVELEMRGIEASEPPGRNHAAFEEGLPTGASGLVILHPFLPQFFKLLGWLSPTQRLLPAKRWHAAQTLHWLVHERLARDEAEVMLEKTLCGIELGEAGELPAELEPAALEEGLELLRSVIAHWGALRNTSPDGLREAFLARPGLLYLGEKNILRVEGRGYDMLLRRLPYSIETVLLPWLKQPLQVEWENL